MRRERKELFGKLSRLIDEYHWEQRTGRDLFSYEADCRYRHLVGELEHAIAVSYGFNDYMDMLFEHQERFNNSFFKNEDIPF